MLQISTRRKIAVFDTVVNFMQNQALEKVLNYLYSNSI